MQLLNSRAVFQGDLERLEEQASHEVEQSKYKFLQLKWIRAYSGTSWVAALPKKTGDFDGWKVGCETAVCSGSILGCTCLSTASGSGETAVPLYWFCFSGEGSAKT